MPKILSVRSVNDYAQYVGAAELHPHVCVIHYDELEHCRHSLNNYGVYGLFLLEESPYELKYGQGQYSYLPGSLLSVAPGQIGGLEDNGEIIHISGWAVLFDRQLLIGTALEQRIKDYRFFSYYESEALRTEPEERRTLIRCFEMLRQELLCKQDDTHQNSILVSYLLLILEYCGRFYERQLKTESSVSGDLLKRFDLLLHDYYERGLQRDYGLPTVKYCARKLCFSPSYFGELIRQNSGMNAAAVIRSFVMRRAGLLLARGQSVSSAAECLGFVYPQHFARMFKKHYGCPPSEYRTKLG
ncbi:MAG: helix-turn-helix domain-containing protein [bacterium]|nr:helix-turn-helix domain-containing protein [bacterium]